MSTLPVCASKLIRMLVVGWLAGQVLAPAQPASAATLTSAVRPGASSDDEISNASAAAKEKPGDVTWTRLGDAYMQKGRETADLSYYGRAEGAYRKALASNPRSANALVGMGWVSGGRHEFEQSNDWARKALAIDPNRADAYGLLGDAAVEMGDYEKAFDQYQKMLDLRPDISSYSRGAHLLFMTGDMRKATLLMTKAIGSGAPFAENTAWCRAQWALMQFAQGSYLSASQLLTEALRTAPNNYHLLAAMGRVKAAMKDYDAAIDYYKRAEAVVPQHEVVVALGDIYTLQGKTQEAAAQYALVDVIHKLNRANGVIGDLQVAQFFADHDRNLDEAVRLAENRVCHAAECLRGGYACLVLLQDGKNCRSAEDDREGAQPGHARGHVPVSQRRYLREGGRLCAREDGFISGTESQSELSPAGCTRGGKDDSGFGIGSSISTKRMIWN